MIGPLAPLRASASARRSLFTSAVRRFDPKDPNVTAVTSDFLARLQMKPTTGASSSAQGQSAHDAARNMIGSLGVRDASAADEGRHKFEPGQVSVTSRGTSALMPTFARTSRVIPVHNAAPLPSASYALANISTHHPTHTRRRTCTRSSRHLV